jgi:hypothetical protein
VNKTKRHNPSKKKQKDTNKLNGPGKNLIVFFFFLNLTVTSAADHDHHHRKTINSEQQIKGNKGR